VASKSNSWDISVWKSIGFILLRAEWFRALNHRKKLRFALAHRTSVSINACLFGLFYSSTDSGENHGT
jgi:hypothetical protein